MGDQTLQYKPVNAETFISNHIVSVGIKGTFLGKGSIYIYLRRQQERGLMQKARRLMDENSVSFQMFLILLSSITLGSESQIPVFKEGQSNT